MAALRDSNAEARFLTREAIRGALWELLRREAYADIRATEIIRRAGVSRSAFYRNYKGKEDVLLDLIDEYADEYREYVSMARRGEWEEVLARARRHYGDVRLLEEAGLTYTLLAEFNRIVPPEGERAYGSVVWNGIVFSVVLHWMRLDMPDERETAARIREGLAGALPYRQERIVHDMEREA